MAEELGKVERPEVNSFKGGRKLFIVPLIFSGRDAPDDFLAIHARCWNQIKDQVGTLQAKLGNASVIYHEMIFEDDEKGMKLLEQLNPDSHCLVKSAREAGARLVAVDDPELATENMDWERCLMVTMGHKARSRIAEFHRETSASRYNHIARRIDETLGPDETGMLIIREGHPTQFASDIEIFNVYPPTLDELNRWLREYASKGIQPPASPV